MNRIKTIVEIIDDEIDDEEAKEAKSGKIKKDLFYLLHWGIKYDMVADSYNNLVPVHYTVGICQNIKSGEIILVLPGDLKVLGINLKEENL